MPVYLLHATQPLTRSNGQTVRHYLGYCEPGNLAKRIGEHARGVNTTPLVRALLGRGAVLLLGNYYPWATRTDERRMKTSGHLSARCLVCDLRKAIAALDALPSLSPRHLPTWTVPLHEPGPNSPPQSTDGAPARTDG